jgi:hypothetical protein
VEVGQTTIFQELAEDLAVLEVAETLDIPLLAQVHSQDQVKMAL